MSAEAKQVAAPVPDTTSIVQVIERAALNPAVDIEKMERLLAMQERILDRNAKAAYAAALSRMQPELPTVAERGTIKNKAGGVQSRYALWEDVVSVITPILSRHGFALTFRTSNPEKLVTVTGVLTHQEGHSEETTLTLPIDSSDFRNLVQSIGSSVSYGKRYTAAALLNLRSGLSEDDDGQAYSRGECISEKQVADITALLSEVGADKVRFLKYIGIDSIESILVANYDAVIRAIEAKRRKQR